MVGAGTIVAGEELVLVGQTRVLVRTVSNIPRMSDTKPQKVDGNSTNQGARSNERRPRGPGEVGPTRPSCKIRERGSRRRQDDTTTTTTTIKTASDMLNHQHTRAMAENSGHLAGQFGWVVAGPLDVHLLQCQHRLQTGYPSIGPVRPVLLAPSSRDHHRPGHQAPSASQASPGLESRQPSPSTSTITSTDPTSSPRTHPNSNTSKLRTKRRLESGRGHRTTEAVTVDLFTTPLIEAIRVPRGHRPSHPIRSHLFMQEPKPKPLVPPVDTTDDRGWTREVTPKQLHLFKKATHFFPLCHLLAVEAPSYPVPPRGNYLMIR